MSNEELAGRARDGDGAALLELWGQVRRLAWRFIPRWTASARLAGLEPEDLSQLAFLGLLRAVGRFRPEDGWAFSTVFVRAMQNEFAAAVGRTERQLSDPLRYASPLDALASSDASEALTLADLIEDPAAEAAIEGTGLRLAVQDIVAELPEEQRAALYRRYWLDLPPREVDRKAHDAALRALRHPSRSRRLRELVRQSD